MTTSRVASAGPAITSESERWMGVGRDDSPDAGTAGRAAALAALAGRDPTLVLVFFHHEYDLPALLAPIQELLPAGAVLAGCSTNGHFALPGTTASEVDAGVVVVGLGGEGLEATARIVDQASADRRQAGATVAGVVEDLGLDHRVLLLLADGLTREQHEIVRGSYSVVGASVPIVGGCSGDDMSYDRAYQVLASRDYLEVVSDGVVGVGLGSSSPVGVGVDHGWSKVGRPFLVTNSSGGRVYELDNRPALDVYLECLGLDRHRAEHDETFRAVAYHHPLGLSRRTGEDIRVVHGADIETGSLLCLADVPQGAIVWQMSTDSANLVAAAGTSLAQAVEGLGGRPPVGVLFFDCGARKVMLETAGVEAELRVIGADPALPVAGFYTFGEIARTQGSRGMHHLTLVTLALS